MLQIGYGMGADDFILILREGFPYPRLTVRRAAPPRFVLELEDRGERDAAGEPVYRICRWAMDNPGPGEQGLGRRLLREAEAFLRATLSHSPDSERRTTPPNGLNRLPPSAEN